VADAEAFVRQEAAAVAAAAEAHLGGGGGGGGGGGERQWYVARLQMLPLVQRPGAGGRLPLPLPAAAGEATFEPTAAGVLVVGGDGGCGKGQAPPLAIDLHDPRPEAGTDLAAMDGGKPIRWVAGTPASGMLLLYPAWLQRTVRLPPNDCPASANATRSRVFLAWGEVFSAPGSFSIAKR
jgi:hypothetical protein